jgi:hypothetical protein
VSNHREGFHAGSTSAKDFGRLRGGGHCGWRIRSGFSQ